MPSTEILRPLLRAATRDGIMLPVIDVTDPRFAVADDAESLARLFERAAAEERQNRRLPMFVMRFLLRRAAKRSLLVQALFGADDTSFLDGISTYVMKLGADYLPHPYDDPMDKRLAASAHLTLLRLRTQQVAHLLADGLAADLAKTPGAPLALVNIAGGPAIDSMNALILLRQRNPELLRRAIAIHVLDQDHAGPDFGRNALAALTQEVAPLAGLGVTFEHRPYDWNAPSSLAALLRELDASGALVAASSEGGLFEYGGDEVVVANLQALRAGRVRAVAGSVTSDDERRRRTLTASRFKLVPRGLRSFAPLAKRGGWHVARSESAQLSDQVLLVPV